MDDLGEGDGAAGRASNNSDLDLTSGFTTSKTGFSSDESLEICGDGSSSVVELLPNDSTFSLLLTAIFTSLVISLVMKKGRIKSRSRAVNMRKKPHSTSLQIIFSRSRIAQRTPTTLRLILLPMPLSW